MVTIMRLFFCVALVSTHALCAATQAERLAALEQVALFIPSDFISDDSSEEEIPAPSDVKRRFNISDAQLLQDILTLAQKYSKSETNENRRVIRQAATRWIGGYGTTNNLAHLNIIMYDNTDFAQEDAVFSVIALSKKSGNLFPTIRSVVTNKIAFSTRLRSSVYCQLHGWCNKKGSSAYREDPELHANIAAFFLERAAVEEDSPLYVDQVACELNPSYRHSQQRRDNLARLRKPGLTGLPAQIYDAAQRDALPKEAK